jgi:NADPH:quinone reductase-like Zn-dependent oxidoreductase
MKSFQLDRFGIDHLRAIETSPQALQPGDVRLRIDAVALNYRDLEIIEGRYAMPVTLPLIPVSDAVGTVVDVGTGVSEWQPGDRVNPIFFPDWQDGPFREAYFATQRGAGTPGFLQEHAVLPASSLVRAPRHIGPAAATLPIAALTAWRALIDTDVRAGETVLVQGLGGVSLFVLQFARMRGALPVVVTSTTERAALAADLGAAATVVRTEGSEWGAQVRDRLGGAGVDVAVEVGGTGGFDQTQEALAVNARVAIVGYLGGAQLALNAKSLFIARRAVLMGQTVGSRRDFANRNRAIEANGLQPVVDSRFGIGEVTQAFERLASGRAVGKILIELNPPADMQRSS